jgi:hypothetical protein
MVQSARRKIGPNCIFPYYGIIKCERTYIKDNLWRLK